MISAAFPPLTIRKGITERTSSGFYTFTGNSIAPDHLTHASPTRLPQNLVRVFQNSNYNIPAFFSIAWEYSRIMNKVCITFRTTLI